MSAERERIDRMQSEGKITQEEAHRLLAALDRSETPEPPPAQLALPPRLSRLAIAGALAFPAAVIAAFLVSALARAFGATAVQAENARVSAEYAVLLVGIVLSISALVAIRNSQGCLAGLGLALFGIIAPILLVVLLTA